MSDTSNNSEQKPEVSSKFVTFEGIREADFFEPETKAWLDKWNAYAKREAARRWAKKHPNPVLRRAINQRIRHGKAWLRRHIRRQRWRGVLLNPSVLNLVKDSILERAQQPSLFRALFNQTGLVEDKK